VTRGSFDRWVVASGNRGKNAELGALFAGMGIELCSLADFTSEVAAETGATFVENALLKARHAARASGLAALADDSGLLVEALGGAPGVLSARFAGPGSTDIQNVAKLLEDLTETPDDARSAAFYCVLVLLRGPDDAAPLVAEGAWHGRITRAPAGAAGFGYDPVFYDPVLGATAAELPAVVKNTVSHRAQAAKHLRMLLEARP
jgi:XTP/dITP diphosphohydrolase